MPEGVTPEKLNTYLQRLVPFERGEFDNGYGNAIYQMSKESITDFFDSETEVPHAIFGHGSEGATALRGIKEALEDVNSSITIEKKPTILFDMQGTQFDGT